MMVIRKSVEADLAGILAIVNDAAHAYRGVIPADRWHEPYMSTEELARELAGGVVFWVAEQAGRLLGVMGIQDKGDVALVRHAYRLSLRMDDGSRPTAGFNGQLIPAAKHVRFFR